MEIFKPSTRIDFMGKRRLAVGVSLLLLLISAVSLVWQGLKLGIDFTGGTVMEVSYPGPIELDRVRDSLEQAGYGRAVVQHFGTSSDVLIRLAPKEGEDRSQVSNRIFEVLQTGHKGGLKLQRVEFVGPQVGEELREKGGLAMLYALAGILIYVALRFEYRFSVGAIIALVHDVVITLGFFSVTQMEFDLSVLAALLAVIGYSLNDTIVVFDRVRENFRKIRKGTSVEIVNTTVNNVLSRTVMTSLTTLLVLLALFFLGGEAIHAFSVALIVGVIIGTYSSIYVASTSLLALGLSRADLMPVKKEGAEADERP